MYDTKGYLPFLYASFVLYWFFRYITNEIYLLRYAKGNVDTKYDLKWRLQQHEIFL